MNNLLSDKFSNLTGAIYDCAVSPERWDITLEALRKALGSAGCALYIFDVANGSQRFQKSVGISEAWSEKFDKNASQYVADSMRMLLSSSQKLIDRLFSEPYIISKEQQKKAYSETRYYNDWIKPQGFTDFIQLTLLHENQMFGSILFGRNEADGSFDDCEIALIRSLAPHLRRAIAIGDMMERKSIKARTCETILDHLSMGVIVVSENGTILQTNRSAQRIFQEADTLCSVNNRIGSSNLAAARLLLNAIALAAKGSSQSMTSIGINASGPKGGVAIANVLPLENAEGTAKGVPGAKAVIFVTCAQNLSEPRMDLFATLFDFTAAETRVVELLIRGNTSVEAARALGITETTVRTHLTRIFSKTGVSRQTELIALIHKMAPQLVSVGKTA